jgi:hypothetical protein
MQPACVVYREFGVLMVRGSMIEEQNLLSPAIPPKRFVAVVLVLNLAPCAWLPLMAPGCPWQIALNKV